MSNTPSAAAILPEMSTPQRELSAPERDVLKLIARSYSNKEIARKLSIPVRKVEDLKSSSMRLLGLRGRIEVVRYASAQGWGEAA